MSVHWETTFDPDTGDPIGSLCYCCINYDHDGAGNPFPADAQEE